MKANSKTGALSNFAALCTHSSKDVYESRPSMRLETKKRQIMNNYSFAFTWMFTTTRMLWRG